MSTAQHLKEHAMMGYPVEIGGGSPPISPNARLIVNKTGGQVTGTTDMTLLASLDIPAGLLNSNGSIRITNLFESSGAGNKLYQINFGGLPAYAVIFDATILSVQHCVNIECKTPTSQIAFGGSPTGFGGSANGLVQMFADTNADTTLEIFGKLDNTAGIINLRHYLIEITLDLPP